MKVHNLVVIDISSGNVEYDDWYEYDGPVEQCKGGSSQSSKPLGLDDFLKNGPYAWLQDYYGDVNTEYDPMDELTKYLATQQGNADILQNELSGDNGAVAQQRNILANLQTPEMMKAAMSPYLNQAYENIGNSGAPSSSYADKLITSGVTQGWLDNTNKTLSGYGNLTGQTKDLTSALTENASNVYDMTTEPLQLAKQIQLARYNSNVTKTGSSGKSGFSLGF